MATAITLLIVAAAISCLPDGLEYRRKRRYEKQHREYKAGRKK